MMRPWSPATDGECGRGGITASRTLAQSFPDGISAASDPDVGMSNSRDLRHAVTGRSNAKRPPKGPSGRVIGMADRRIT